MRDSYIHTLILFSELVKTARLTMILMGKIRPNSGEAAIQTFNSGFPTYITYKFRQLLVFKLMIILNAGDGL